MAPILGMKIVQFATFLVSLILTYHVVILVEGMVLTKEEELNIERQLNILNKSPVKTMHAQWGDTYDCIEFQKQPAFDHPLLKDHKIQINEELDFTNSLEMLTNRLDGCPKGTVPIRRTTREDLMTAKLSSNSIGDQYRAGVSYGAKPGETIYGISGEVNVWNPHVNPQIYGDNVTHGFAYWTTDNGKNTGCYNTLCPGFIQVHREYTPDMPFDETSKIGGDQIYFTLQITLDILEGKWWLTLQDNIRVGYWPVKLFPAFSPGAASAFWGGCVKSGSDGMSPSMCSGQPITKHAADACIINNFRYVNMSNYYLEPENTEYTIDCWKHYNAILYPGQNIVQFGGSGGANCK
ncbi:hypothetical protein MKW94_026853 [Papaver nudicaule]|uniref:Neprosin PEP catalytic domain-containing protein n=1 Tax=Papaver nudicaule TaxID=74823 RepID=A0AA42AZC2_PAPNU|nr:hypothetical protein [Papaver nudicaule]